MNAKKGKRGGKRRVPFKSYRKNNYLVTKKINTNEDIHYFKRMTFKGNFTGNITTVYNQALTFSITDLVNSSEFTALFDQYRIDEVTLKFTLGYDPSALTTNAIFPRMWSVIDYDDSNTPADSNELRQRAKTKYTVLNPNKTYTFKLRPATLTQTYINGVQTGYKPEWNKWIDIASPVPFYGMKFALELFYTGQFITCECIYNLAFKNTR